MQSVQAPLKSEPPDPTYYIENDEMGESGFQFFASHRLVDLMAFFFETTGEKVVVSGNQFIHLEQGNSQANLAPDVYVIRDEVTPAEEIKSWKLWEHGGKGPCLGVEIVSESAEEAAKDYEPPLLAKYERLGVQELLRYDPYGMGRQLRGQRRRLLTHWVRNEEGRLAERPLGDPHRVRSTQFSFWFVHVAPRMLRLGIGPEGLVLFPSRLEASVRRAEEEARRAEEEAKRAEEEAKRAEEEAKRAEVAEQRLQEVVAREVELLAELERLRAASRELPPAKPVRAPRNPKSPARQG